MVGEKQDSDRLIVYKFGLYPRTLEDQAMTVAGTMTTP